MIILPKQLHTSASVVDTKALDLDSEEFSQICEKSLTWRGKDSLSRTWLQRWKRENWMQHLCSRTLKPFHTESFVDAWISSLEDSRANRLVLLESVKALKTLDTCFHTSPTESESAIPELFSSKMLKELSPVKQQMDYQFSNMSSESWKAWITEQRQEYSQRVKSAHLIRESECLFWATPIENDAKGSDYAGTKENPKGLYRGGQVKNWPTVTVGEEKYRIKGNSQESKSLSAMAVRGELGLPDQANRSTSGKNQEFWPTPRANKVHPEITHQNRKQLANRKKSNLEEDIAGHCGKATGKLNPDWVEQLMGIPVGWTQLSTGWIDSDC